MVAGGGSCPTASSPPHPCLYSTSCLLPLLCVLATLSGCCCDPLLRAFCSTAYTVATRCDIGTLFAHTSSFDAPNLRLPSLVAHYLRFATVATLHTHRHRHLRLDGLRFYPSSMSPPTVWPQTAAKPHCLACLQHSSTTCLRFFHRQNNLLTNSTASSRARCEGVNGSSG